MEARGEEEDPGPHVLSELHSSTSTPPLGGSSGSEGFAGIIWKPLL